MSYEAHSGLYSSLGEGLISAHKQTSACQRTISIHRLRLREFPCAAEGEARKDIVSMVRKLKSARWSYAEDRRVLELAKQSRSLEEIANLINRSPEAIHTVAIRLGISLRTGRRRSTPPNG